MDKEILVLVLSNGDQLLAETIVSDGAYLCSNVLQILTQPDEATGHMRMGIIAYLPFTDPAGGVAIPTNMAILAVPNEDLKTHYQEKFKMIITPPSKIIL